MVHNWIGVCMESRICAFLIPRVPLQVSIPFLHLQTSDSDPAYFSVISYFNAINQEGWMSVFSSSFSEWCGVYRFAIYLKWKVIRRETVIACRDYLPNNGALLHLGYWRSSVYLFWYASEFTPSLYALSIGYFQAMATPTLYPLWHCGFYPTPHFEQSFYKWDVGCHWSSNPRAQSSSKTLLRNKIE